MMGTPPRFRLMTATLALMGAFSLFSACHRARAGETARTPSPSVDVEIEDVAPGAHARAARFTLVLVDGHARLKAQDGTAKYELAAQLVADTEPKLQLEIKRHDPSASIDMAATGAIPQRAGPRVVVARVDHAGGRSTTIVAQAH